MSLPASQRVNVYVNPPEGVARHTFRNVVSAAHMAFQLHNQDWKNREKNGTKTLPDVQEIARYCSHTPKTVSKVVATNEFAMAMRSKGITWTARDGLTPEQVYCIGIMTNPSDKRDMNGKLKAAGVTYQVYRGWLKQPTFRRAVHKIGEEMLDDHIADVNTALLNKAVGGDVRAIELYNQITGRFDPSKQQTQDLGNLVNILLETIFRYVTDVNVLKRITDDFDKAMDGRAVEAELVIEGNVIEELPDRNEVLAKEEKDAVDSLFEDSDNAIPVGFFDFHDEG